MFDFPELQSDSSYEFYDNSFGGGADLAYTDISNSFPDPSNQLLDHILNTDDKTFSAFQEWLFCSKDSNIEQTKSNHYSTTQSTQSTFVESGVQPRKRGKKKLSQPRHSRGRVWEFILQLLFDQTTCPRLLKWVNQDEGIFKFVDSSGVAKLWGDKSNNPRMNFEKFSRAMRYHYLRKNLVSVPGKRLVYKFGPNAKGWRISS